MTTTVNHTIEIPASQIIGATEFEEARRDAYTTSEDVEARSRALTELASTTRVAGGAALSDVVLEAATRPPEASQLARDRLERISDEVATAEAKRKHDQETYKFVVNDDGDIAEAQHLTLEPEDKLATKRSQRQAKKIGWGPKQNETSVVLPHAPRGTRI